MNPIPKPGERWHWPKGCNRQEHPGAKDVEVIAILHDTKYEDPHAPGTPMRIAVCRIDGKSGPRFVCEELWLWESGSAWAKGPLPKGPKGESDE